MVSVELLVEYIDVNKHAGRTYTCWCHTECHFIFSLRPPTHSDSVYVSQNTTEWFKHHKLHQQAEYGKMNVMSLCMCFSLFGSIQEEVVKDAESVRNQQQQHLQQHSCTLDECFQLYTKEEQVRLKAAGDKVNAIGCCCQRVNQSISVYCCLFLSKDQVVFKSARPKLQFT